MVLLVPIRAIVPIALTVAMTRLLAIIIISMALILLVAMLIVILLLLHEYAI